MRLFQRFDQPKATDLQHKRFNWLFGKLNLNRITLDVDSAVITRWGHQIEGASKGYNSKNHGRNSHHPLIAFVADWRLVANFFCAQAVLTPPTMHSHLFMPRWIIWVQRRSVYSGLTVAFTTRRLSLH